MEGSPYGTYDIGAFKIGQGFKVLIRVLCGLFRWASKLSTEALRIRAGFWQRDTAHKYSDPSERSRRNNLGASANLVLARGSLNLKP